MIFSIKQAVLGKMRTSSHCAQWHCFSPERTLSRHGIAQAILTLLICLIENVGLRAPFSRHDIAEASFVLHIWLIENVR